MQQRIVCLLGPRWTVNVARLDVGQEGMLHALAAAPCERLSTGRYDKHVRCVRWLGFTCGERPTLLVVGPFRRLAFLSDLTCTAMALISRGFAALQRLVDRLFGSFVLLKLVANVNLLDIF